VSEKEKVLFYEGKFYMFSNFSSFAVEWNGALWMTSEHAYQAAKFSDAAIREKIQKSRSAHVSKKIAEFYKSEIIGKWDNVKLKIMESIIRAKLAQHSYIQKKLLETGDLELVEDSPKDSFWGRGPDWKGHNHLGKIWMRLREELKMSH
jgi:ribA/ribD-fused uncharacterized protein